MVESVAHKLLVASPELVDPNFSRAAVLMIEHDEKGALGVVLNRPAGLEVGEILDDWTPYVADPPVVFRGGPVSPEVALTVGDTPGEPPTDFTPIVAGCGLLDAGLGPDAVGGVLRARIFSGYAGWTAGQLEAELDEKSWFVCDPTSSDIFDPEPETLWVRVVRRQRGIVSWYAEFPEHPEYN